MMFVIAMPSYFSDRAKKNPAILDFLLLNLKQLLLILLSTVFILRMKELKSLLYVVYKQLVALLGRLAQA